MYSLNLNLALKCQTWAAMLTFVQVQTSNLGLKEFLQAMILITLCFSVLIFIQLLLGEIKASETLQLGKGLAVH